MDQTLTEWENLKNELNSLERSGNYNEIFFRRNEIL